MTIVRRFLARRKMRWAMRHRRDWRVQFWIAQRQKERRPAPDWYDVEVTTTYAWSETDAS